MEEKNEKGNILMSYIKTNFHNVLTDMLKEDNHWNLLMFKQTFWCCIQEQKIDVLICVLTS